MKGRFQLALAALLLAALPCLASDSAILRNGFAIRHERRQIIGTVTRLYIDGDQSSFVDIPTAEIDHFESLPDSPTPPPHPPPPTPPHPLPLTQPLKHANPPHPPNPPHQPPPPDPPAPLRSPPSRKGRQRNLPPRSRSRHQRHPRRKRIQDRKSTRLNSSHLGISYAVF